MGNTVFVESEAYKVEGGAIKVGRAYRMGKHQRAIWEDIPSSTNSSIIVEQAIDSCLLDHEGDGVRRLDSIGAGGEGRKAIQGLNEIINSVNWSASWLNDTKPQGWLCLCLFLHILGVCIALCIIGGKITAIKDKRNDLMTQARQYAKDFNSSSGAVDLKIPQRFTEYVEFSVKNNMGSMGMGGPQQMMYDPNMMYQQQMPQYYQQQQYPQQYGYQQPQYGLPMQNDAMQQQMWGQQQQNQQPQNITIQLNQAPQ